MVWLSLRPNAVLTVTNRMWQQNVLVYNEVVFGIYL